ncbi:trypco2 family protein [Streptomyces odontomachi]|uniref:trypco2 family protein n=1 Tax=Streptomyces odontomachi TaxID=2944940 RepID=UPI00210899E0|nr:trypco2 family protein [Streptomyces sp. ODS25]
MPEELELAAAVHLVRGELLHAAATAAHEDLRFEVGPIGMEFTVELRRDVRAKAGFRAWVVSGDSEAQAGRTRTHKVSLTLTPRHADGTSVAISRDSADRQGGDGDTALFVPAPDPS